MWMEDIVFMQFMLAAGLGDDDRKKPGKFLDFLDERVKLYRQASRRQFSKLIHYQ